MNNYYHFIIMDLINIKFPDIKMENIHINEIYEIDPGYANTSLVIDCTITRGKYRAYHKNIIVRQQEYKMMLRDYNLKKIGI